MRGRRTLLAISIAVAAFGSAALIACGGGGESDEETVQDLAVEWVETIGDGDFTGACDLMGTAGDRRLCPQALKQITSQTSLDFPEATDVSITGDTGKVEVETSGDQIVVLVKQEDGEWVVDDLNLAT